MAKLFPLSLQNRLSSMISFCEVNGDSYYLVNNSDHQVYLWRIFDFEVSSGNKIKNFAALVEDLIQFLRHGVLADLGVKEPVISTDADLDR